MARFIINDEDLLLRHFPTPPQHKALIPIYYSKKLQKRLSSQGEENPEGRPLPLGTIHADFTPMVLYDLQGNGQAESGSLLFRAKEGVEYPGEILPGNTASRIGDLDLEHRFISILTEGDSQFSSSFHGFQGVLEYIYEGLGDLISVDIEIDTPIVIAPLDLNLLLLEIRLE